MHACASVHMCVHVHTRVRIGVPVHVRVRVSVRVRVHVHVCVCAFACACACAHVCACACACASVCVHVCACMHVSVISRLSILFRIYAKPTKDALPIYTICVVVFSMWDYLFVYFWKVMWQNEKLQINAKRCDLIYTNKRVCSAL